MNYQQFTEAVYKKVTALLGDTATTQIQTAIKNNDTERIGLIITPQATNLSPTIYLEEFYKLYEQGCTLDEISEDILRIYKKAIPEHSWDVNQIQDFEQAKSKLVYKLIHTERNKALLETIPHVPYLDLSMAFYLLLDTFEHGIATILITNQMLEHWKIDAELLYHLATVNTPNLLPSDFMEMKEVIEELLGRELTDEEDYENHMYVLTNSYRHLGAACILYPHTLEEIGNQLDEDFYLLPSSIHEIIILPVQYAIPTPELAEIIDDINNTQVLKEEVLSDHAYYYSRKEKKLVIAQ